MSPFRTKSKLAYHLLEKKEILQAQCSSAAGQASLWSPLWGSGGQVKLKQTVLLLSNEFAEQ